MLHTVMRGGKQRTVAMIAAVSTFLSKLPSGRRLCKGEVGVRTRRTLSFRGLRRGLSVLKCRERGRIRDPKRFTIENKVLSMFPLARRGPIQVRL